jgi:hypothetical protein
MLLQQVQEILEAITLGARLSVKPRVDQMWEQATQRVGVEESLEIGPGKPIIRG